MSSQIDPSTIDITYPIAGQDNDTRGFHNNYRAIQNGLVFAKAEIEDLQANVATVQNSISNVILSNVAYPSTASSVGTTGQVAFDATHIYVCVATNTWVRANLAAW